MFTFAIAAAFVLPLFASTIADSEERTDADVFKHPRKAEHEAEIIPLRYPTKIEIIPAYEREDDYGYGDCLKELRA